MRDLPELDAKFRRAIARHRSSHARETPASTGSLLRRLLLLLSISSSCCAWDCFQTPSDRYRELSGSWSGPRSGDKSPPPLYYNLSCPFEWSKYSCAHQGATAKAIACASLRFNPSSGCTLPAISGDTLSSALGAGGNIHVRGDSLSREIFIALACALHATTTSAPTKVLAGWAGSEDWQTADMPCHGTLNCVAAGPHSGFIAARLVLPSGASISYGQQPSHWPQLQSSRVFEVITGGHAGTDEKRYNLMGKDLLLTRKLFLGPHKRRVFAFVGPPHFQQSNDLNHPQSGEYNKTYLDELFRKSGQNVGCLDKAEDLRGKREWAMLETIGKQSSGIAGIVALAKLETLGATKIGSGVGSRGDCVHFCMPGVPDAIARGVYALVMAIVAEEKGSREDDQESSSKAPVGREEVAEFKCKLARLRLALANEANDVGGDNDERSAERFAHLYGRLPREETEKVIEEFC